MEVILMFIILLIIIGIILGIAVQHKTKEIELMQKNTTTTTPTEIEATYISDDKSHTIRRIDNKPISDDEISDLIKLGYQHAIEREKQSKNIKFHRTFKEEELVVQFMINHGEEIGKCVDSFEDCYSSALAEKDINKKIELLEETIIKFEKAKAWFYRTKGGTIYFQDMYEYLHNSRDDDYSYIDEVKEYLEECIEERDYLIPEILNIIESSNGILQKDIYQYLPDVSRGNIQRIIRELDNEGQITREKAKGSYLLTIK